MTEEEKDFVIKDRRSFDEKGEFQGKESEDQKKEEKSKVEAEKEKPEITPLPAPDLTSLVFSLSSSAIFHLGEIADPQTDEKKKDLPLAKHAVDTIAMLKEKTKGNLTEEEKKFLDSILTDLRWRYVKVSEA